ncbi:hypothetical protein MMPV_002735 [Pyropia vietnamensis]
MTTIWRGDSELDVRAAAATLRRGGTVAFPTETVYGLGADAFNDAAVRAVYAAKGRPPDNPLILHVASAAALADLPPLTPLPLHPVAAALADAFWPGPLTLILPGGPSPTAAAHVVADLDGRIDGVLDGGDSCAVGLESTVVDVSTVGVGGEVTILRPGAVGASAIATVAGVPVTVATEAGSGGGDGGGGGDGDGDGSGGGPNGGYTPPAPPRAVAEGSDVAPRAPGMKYRHYAPAARVRLVSPPTAAAFATAAAIAAAEGITEVGVLAPADVCAALGVSAPAPAPVPAPAGVQHNGHSGGGGGSGSDGGSDGGGDISTPRLRLVPCGETAADVAGVARSLYAGLRALDRPATAPVTGGTEEGVAASHGGGIDGGGGGGGRGGVDLILVATVTDGEGLSGAVMNRLRKAAAGGGSGSRPPVAP